jgi:hypothetical protein
MHIKEWVAMVTTDQAFEIPSIGPTLEMIKQIAEKLQEQLNEMGIARSPVKQFLHLFASGTKERTKLEDFVRRMANAKIDLIVRIQLELIGLNRNMQAAVKLSVERIVALDARLSEHSGIGNYPKLAKLLSNHRQNSMNPSPQMAHAEKLTTNSGWNYYCNKRRFRRPSTTRRSCTPVGKGGES